MDERFSYLGKAMEYPVSIVNGKAKIVTGLPVIESSIIKILSTPKGSRFFLREYGSRLNEIMWEPNDQVLQSILRMDILASLTMWETRARFTDVITAVSNDMILCDIRYQVLASNEIKSFVFPIYKSLVW